MGSRPRRVVRSGHYVKRLRQGPIKMHERVGDVSTSLRRGVDLYVAFIVHQGPNLGREKIALGHEIVFKK